MARTSRIITTPRKLPVQARSTQLVDAILKAAVRVLEREGASRFTTIRVAQAAGVSVGSLYQYFPNKQSILFRLQLDEWAKTGGTIEDILADTSHTAARRLRTMMRAFFRSECEEAPLRRALGAAVASYRAAPEARAGRKRAREIVKAFVAKLTPEASPGERKFATDLLFLTMTAIGKEVSERNPRPKEVDRWADAVSQMLIGYMRKLRPNARPKKPFASLPPARARKSGSITQRKIIHRDL